MDSRNWPLRGLGLRVLDLPREVAYYQRLGLTLIESGVDSATLGFAAQPVLHLRLLRDGRPRPRAAAGLFHFALLLPDERHLGQFLLRCADLAVPLDGASDHLVSQALYLSDPEGNGIEVYADRPAETWNWSGQLVRMATEPLDLERLMAGAGGSLAGFPESSRLGHMHITSGQVDRSFEFYRELGMDLTASLGPFRFAAWEHYHHHLGINLLRGAGASRVADESAGIDFFEVARPGLKPGTLLDPDGIEIRVRKAPAG